VPRVLSLLGIGLALFALTAARAERPPAHLSVELASGVLSQSNSNNGAAILNAANLRPGESRSGSVQIANTGDLAGTFSLAQSNLGDTPGPLGGPLSGGLDLLLEDVTAPAAPVPIYSGALAGLGSRPLGEWAPGTSRSYRFTVSLPAAGTVALAGSAASVSYVWTATADEPSPAPGPPVNPPAPAPAPDPGGGGGGTAARDITPPRIVINAGKRQKLVRRKSLAATVSCDEPCTLTATAKAGGRARKVRFATWTAKTSAPKTSKFRLKLSRKALKAAKKALRGRRTAKATITVKATDLAGNVATATKRVKVSR